MRFSDQTVRSLPHPEAGQRDYADDTVRGLSVRVGKRAKTFTVVTGSGKNRKRHTLGQYDPPYFTLAMAREKARDIIAKERLGKTELPRLTYMEAVEIYDRVHLSQLRPASSRNVRRALRRTFGQRLGNVVLADIKRSHIAPLLDTMLDTPAAMASNFRYLRAFLNWAGRRGYIEHVPTDRMETPKAVPSRSRVLSPQELVAIWNAAPESDYGRIVKLAILTGQRRSQWGAMRREYIQGATVVFPASLMKAGKEHILPLTPTMRELLPDRLGYLFPNENNIEFGNWTRNKDRLDKASGVEGYRHHDFRRTWATVAAEELDIAPHIIEAVLAHASGTTVSRTYNRARYIEQMRKALLAFEEWLQALIKIGEAAA